MNKDLEALNRVRNKFIDFFHEDTPDFDILEQALTELKAIKEANPSGALELVYCLKDYLMNMMPYYDWLNDIEKYILKAQEQEKKLKALEILKNYNICER